MCVKKCRRVPSEGLIYMMVSTECLHSCDHKGSKMVKKRVSI